ncbi:MAG: GxxExxY protein [Candidatus Omnitrophica bacterium]|jgi:GxxExxY protein|nr:GxxExxY protein [Candidatus Omnitrophota bacterium]
MAVDNNYVHSDTTDKIIGLAIKVHKVLGPGFTEKFYEKALISELSEAKIDYIRQKEIKVKYNNILLGTQRIDLVIENKIIVELKIVSEISESNIAQIISYLRAAKIKIGLILNFAKNRLEIKRVVV